MGQNVQDRHGAPQRSVSGPSQMPEYRRQATWVVLVIAGTAIAAGIALGQPLLLVGGVLMAASTAQLSRRPPLRRGMRPRKP